MGKVLLIGLGLYDDRGMSLEGLEEAKKTSKVFAEFYTNPMPSLRMDRLERALNQEVTVLSRTQIEDENGAAIIDAARQGDVAFLVPGDPLISTTHVSLRLSLSRRGIESRIVHASSIVTAVCGATGLQNYKFGKSTTLPNLDSAPPSVVETILENRNRGLHTLLLLDTAQVNGKSLTIRGALARLSAAHLAMDEWLAVGAARIGSDTEKLQAARIKRLKTVDFGEVPHVLVIPSRLHFMEAEALRAFSGASPEDVE